MHADEHAGVLHAGPEGVELRKGERARSLEAGHGGGTDEDHPSAPRQHPLQLLDGLLDDRQGDDRRREDPSLVVERPVLVHPLVEGVDDGVGGLGVVAEALLDQAGQRRPQEDAVDALLVHELQPGTGLTEGGQRDDGLAKDLAGRFPLGVAPLEVLLLGPGSRHLLEGRVGDVVADAPLHRDLGAALDVDVVDHALVPTGEELRQRVARLVHVVVGVEDREVELARRHVATLDDASVRSQGVRRARIAPCPCSASTTCWRACASTTSGPASSRAATSPSSTTGSSAARSWPRPSPPPRRHHRGSR